MASAMPAAAETKLWNVSPTICVRCDIVDSPLYACQFVFVVNETAVFQARSGATAPSCVGIERQEVLHALNRVRQQQSDRAEDEHGDRVLHPVVLFLLIDAATR